MAGASVGVAATGRLMPEILARLNISRCALCGQAEHLKMWRSIPHTVAVSVCTCIRRIPAPHATHFITPPEPSVHMEPIGRRLSSGRRELRRDVAAGPRMATKACGTCAHSGEIDAMSGPRLHRCIPFLRVPGVCESPGVTPSLQLQVASPGPLAGACHSAIALCRSLGRNAPKLQPLRDLRRDDGMMTLSGTRLSVRQATNHMSDCFRRV